jgi:hypothetical protein
MTIELVQKALDVLGSPYALIGAHAMAVRGYPRFTIDVDILTADERVLNVATWEGLRHAGTVVEPRRGDADDPLGGVVHLLLADDTDVDVVLAKWKWEAQLIERAELVQLATGVIRVPRTSDLILLKLAAGGYGDLQDAAALLAIGDAETTIREVEAHINAVRPDIHALWRDLLAHRTD